MADPLRLLTALAEAAGAYGQLRRVRRKVGQTILLVIAGVAGLVALGFALAALWLYAAPTVGQGGAALILAGVFILLSLLSVLSSRLLRGRPSAPHSSAARELEAVLDSAGALIKKHQHILLLVALLAGVLMSDAGKGQPKPRK
jgi:hypothetical protein